ncbi:MAG TPA: protein kinase [Candidatus Polarisedimenticolia bacterium]|nr:protein kinase [Candidatus Polarisedimenticolia bacterium]
MSLEPGTRLGPYEIVGPLGAGGMGEVYRAKDTRLGRDVAIKVLPAHLSSQPELRQRLEREARAVSSLNHPHICTLFDIGHHEGTDFLVMEHLEGETLAERLRRGPLPFPELMRAAIQIADAMDRAHRSGIIHRDLKPGNVMLTKAGTKLLDFGLAKEMGIGSAPSSLTASPTMLSPLTAGGAILGTFQYMAPEQLDGKEADARSDVFALGAVIYEMATGTRAFEGKTQASLIASILKEEPRPIRATVPAAPVPLDRLVKQCLQKDPDERIQSAHDVRLQLEAIAEGAASAPESTPAAAGHREPRRSRERLAWVIAAVAAIAAAAAAAAAVSAGFFRTEPPPFPVVSSIAAPVGAALPSNILPLALSPDGRQIAFVARGTAGNGIWVRPLDSGKARLLPGTEGSECPFWSPDSRSIGFYAGGKLKKIDLAGGQSDVLAPMGICLGASWSPDGSILYIADRYLPITRISAAGGEPQVLVAAGSVKGKRVFSQPSLLPDGKHLLYTVNEIWEGGENSGIFVATTEGKDERKILPILSNARYVPPGYLIYAKDGSLRAQRFDLKNLEVSGDPVTLADGIQYFGFYASNVFSVTDTGMLAFLPGGGIPARQLTWIDRQGAVLEKTGKPGNYFSPRVSHDGRRIAVDQSEATSDSGDIWVQDRERGIATRLSFDPRNESSPIWSPDDRRILFFGNFPSRNDLFTVSSDGTGSIETLLSNEADNLPSDWSSDGKFILYQTSKNGIFSNTDLMIFSVDEKKSEPWLVTPYAERQARFSPDLRWIAYSSDESGRTEVYVRGFHPPGGKWRISSDGGSAPVWRPDGKELFFVSADAKVMSVAVRPGAAFDGAPATPLFGIPGDMFDLSVVTQFDVAPDGRSFLMNLEAPADGPRMITLVTNWPSLLKPGATP